ncbi:MAG: hypothetical protein KDK76_03145 [Chlamydiia bacterium]|nr:hypothetical protein [Chlamydiia bacterium]
MSGISSIGSSGHIPPPEPSDPTINNPDEATALQFLQDQFANKITGIASERTILREA